MYFAANAIKSLAGMGPLPQLRRLEVAFNALETTAGIAPLPMLQELILVSKYP